MGDPAALQSVVVAPERLAGWLSRYEERHGPIAMAPADDVVQLTAADGATARLHVPFPPLPAGTSIVDHALTDRLVGTLLVRRGGYAVGVFEGARLTASKVGSSHVQGRTKAGGWSQQRYARRRENQAAQVYARAADAAVAILLPRLADLDAVVGGGDRLGVQAVLDDSRLSGVRRLWGGEFWPTADPGPAVLRAFPNQFRSVRIELDELSRR